MIRVPRMLRATIFVTVAQILSFGQNVIQNPTSSQNIVQPVSAGQTTQFTANNQSGMRWVTGSFNWSYTDSGGSLGNLTSPGKNLVITLPCSAAGPSSACPAGIDASGGAPFPLSGTVSMTSGNDTVTETSAQFYTNYVGLPIQIPGAGPSGTTLSSIIVGFADSTHVTIADNASTTVSGKTASVASYVYSIYISGAGGTAEVVPVIGGGSNPCTPGATSSCTLLINTANAHPNGYTISSASGGIQEAINDGSTSGTSYAVKLEPRSYNVYATFVLRNSTVRFEADGAMVNCYTRDYCGLNGSWQGHPLVVGDTIKNLVMVPQATIAGCSGNTYCNVSSYSASGNTFTVTTSGTHSFKGPVNGIGADVVDCEMSTTGDMRHFASKIQSVTSNTFTLGLDGNISVAAGAYTFGFCRPIQTAWEDNGDHTVFDNMQLVAGSGTFAFGITNENDQHAVVRAFSNRGGGGMDATYPVGAVFYQRSDRGYAGIFNISDAEISNANCYTGGSNGLVISGGNVCQGFPVFGIRYFGGLQPAVISPTYQESGGATTNPLYGAGFGTPSMAYLFSGGLGQRLLGAFPTGGGYPLFPCTGGSGSITQRNYYVQALNGSLGAGPLVYIGSSATTNCSGATISLAWPAPLGVDITGLSVGNITWNLLVTTGSTATPPIVGTMGSYFLLYQSSAPTCGANGMCTWSDTQASPTTHTVPGPFFPEQFWFWPASFVSNGTILYTDIGPSGGQGLVSSNAGAKIAEVALDCINTGSNPQISAAIIKCLDGGAGPGFSGASTLFYPWSTAGSGYPVNSKGILNFGPEQTNLPLDLITLCDKGFNTTIASPGYHPSADTNDCAVGEDQTGGLAMRSATSFSVYTNTAADNSSYKERLTNTAKTFAVPTGATGLAPNLSGTGACATTGSQTGGSWSGSLVCTGTTGAATITITPGGIHTGWSCSSSDITAGAVGAQSASTTTSCTIKYGSVTHNDVLTFTANWF